MQKKVLLQSRITNDTFANIKERILALGSSRTSSYICIANVHMLIEAHKNPDFNDILNNADIATPDGKPLAIFMNLLYGTHQERVAGPDLMQALFPAMQDEMLSAYFYGSIQDVLDALREKLALEYPNLRISGMKSPPFRPLSDEELAQDAADIENSGAHIVFVGLGCPKQERWMAQNVHRINAVMIGVGAAFPFYTGHIKRAPKWMQAASLEWLYRLFTEPCRLFNRYLTTNTMFLFLMFYQLFCHKISKICALIKGKHTFGKP
jgi:N-acetylglucosaminyldiphosphoundecaprenol N-acetyl-beta-D-mannosaminyltransferase